MFKCVALILLMMCFSILKGQDHPIWDINDSISNIPCYDDFCDWNNVSIHPYKNDFTKLDDSLKLCLIYDSCDFSPPTTGKINSRYGWRSGRPHYGLDVKITYGDTLKSIFEGVCRIAKYSRSYGNVIVIRHNNGFETLYAHLTKRHIKNGDYVQAGDVIGLGGCTGRCSGAHLHLETRYLGEAINPEVLFEVSDSTFQIKSDSICISKDDFILQKKARSIRYYTIRSGDTLYGIARKNSTSITSLCRLNGISKTTTLRIGKRLRVN